MPWPSPSDAETWPINEAVLTAWLDETEDRWWIEAAEAAGWRRATGTGNEWNDRFDLLVALRSGGFPSIEAFEVFLADARRDWADEALRAVNDEVTKHFHPFTAYPVDPLTVLALVGRNANLEAIESTAYLRPYRDAIEAVISARTGVPIPPRSAMRDIPFDPFAGTGYWPDSLRGPAAKVERARQQVGHLAVDVQSFLQRNPIHLRVDPHRKAGRQVPGQLVARAKDVRDPPLDWSLRGAEIIYNVRSALDQLVYQLAWANRRTAGKRGRPRGLTAFPIARTEPDYERFRNPEQGGDPLAELHPDAIATIEHFQPFNPAPAHDPPNQLPFISSISNEDKHRVVRPILQTLSDFGMFQTSYDGCDGVNHQVVWDMKSPLKNNATISILHAVNPRPDFHAEIHGHIPVQVTLQGHGPLLLRLSDAVEYVAYVVGKFQRFFPGTS
jgi:hypothetical protein